MFDRKQKLDREFCWGIIVDEIMQQSGYKRANQNVSKLWSEKKNKSFTIYDRTYYNSDCVNGKLYIQYNELDHSWWVVCTHPGYKDLNDYLNDFVTFDVDEMLYNVRLFASFVINEQLTVLQQQVDQLQQTFNANYKLIRKYELQRELENEIKWEFNYGR